MRIGIDIGGTFTDFAVWTSPAAGYSAIQTFKRSSTPHDYAEAVIQGIDQIIKEHRLTPAYEVTVVHGTTVGTNAVIERSQDPVCLIVTKGHRDILEFARLRLDKPMNLFGIRKAPLIPREFVLEVSERVDKVGAIITPISLQDVRAAALEAQNKGIKKIAVCFLHGFRQPEHERQAVQLINDEFDDIEAMASHEIWPEPGEYERAVVTMLNLYVKERMDTYIGRIEDYLAKTLPNSSLLITRSNGGSMSAAEARKYPVHTLLSGPAAGVTGAEHLRTALNLGDVLTMDMGGTSTDLSLIAEDAANVTGQAEIGDFPMFLPVTAIEALGAGGGSVIWADQDALKIGPRSAGSFPGPACYGNGGQDPTLTDAFLLCGLLPTGGLLGGKLELDAEKSREAFERLADEIEDATPMGLARSAMTLTNSEMLVKTLPFLARQGVEPQTLSLLVYGGAGGIQGPAFAWELGIQRVIIPRMTSVLCAYGCLVSNLVTDLTNSTQGQRLDECLAAQILRDLSREGAAWAEQNGGNSIRHEWYAELRFPSQSFCLPVQISSETQQGDVLKTFRQNFLAEHQRLYGTVQDGVLPVVDQFRVRTISDGVRPKMDGKEMRAPKNACLEPLRTRQVTLPKAVIMDCPIYSTVELVTKGDITGPAILEDKLSTILVPPGFSAQAMPTGDILIEAEQGVKQ